LNHSERNKNITVHQSNFTAVCSNIKLNSFYEKGIRDSFKIKEQSVMPPCARLMVVAETSPVSPKAHKIFNARYRPIGNEINIYIFWGGIQCLLNEDY
jgi:hypothetical protein